MAVTYINARHKESILDSVAIGMPREQAEGILGPGIQNRREVGQEPSCPICPQADEEIVYEGNPSLWLKRFEDSLHVCYAANMVCDKFHAGL
jgi:hypothetical protein